MSLFDTKDKHEFQPLLVEIEQKPTSPLGRVLLWTLFIFIIITFLWLFFAKIDIVVTAKGKVIPSGEIKILQPIENGVISTIFIKEGSKVKKGDVLMELDPSITSSDSSSKKQNLNLLNLEIERIGALLNDKIFNPQKNELLEIEITNQMKLFYTLKESLLNQENRLKNQILQTNTQIQTENADKNRLSQLLDNAKQKENRLSKVRDIIAKNDYEDILNQVIDYTQQIKIRELNIQKLKEKITEIKEQLSVLKQEFRNKLLEELTQKTKEATTLKTQLLEVDFRKIKQKILAPEDGYIGKMFIHTIGGVVTPAEKLLTLVPNNAPLLIKANLLNQDVGFVKKDMQTAIKIDTFDFQKYGLLSGSVTNISKDAIEDEKLGLIYEILIKPDSYTLIVENEELPISIGMGTTVELKVGKRRVIEFFVYPLIKYLDEGMSIR